MPGLHIANGAEPKDSLSAFVFDIDGVFIRGEKLIPGARETIRLLQRRNDPFIFLTNGGGHTEQKRVEKLGQRLGLTLDAKQFVQSHTPYYDLVSEYGDKTVLVLGAHGDQIRDLAHKYGFKKVLTSSDIMAERPLIHPFPEMTKAHHEKYGRNNNILDTTPISAIMFWSSSRDLGLDLQIITDLLLSAGGFIGTKSPKNGDPSLPNNGYQQDNQPKLFFCNPDFLWSTEYHEPRLAQGAALAALKGVWDEMTGGKGDLLYTSIGKPTEPTYVYAEKVLREYGKKLHPSREIGTVYMIGDNPRSDIVGAKDFKSRCGYKWKSVLVETGVHVPGSVPAHQPDHTAANVKEAVEWVLRKEKLANGAE
ncbi:HAD-superfamily hydrolase [Daldinia decipiens]|uniref:HAD-superfamily hydrolase n=1 Tax=Daldinia decipiens TaxID=326647 RepID=UPI0020C35E76|nr:HAD-superfamily hydrolase [Daldinia decipiens]KAI1662615.1 HAD-superfamily hydrolase [Daldinia decipiens]